MENEQQEAIEIAREVQFKAAAEDLAIKAAQVAIKTVSDAAVLAKDVVDKADIVAQALVRATSVNEDKLTSAVSVALRNVFTDDNLGDPKQMKVINQRIPLLCLSVQQTQKDISEIHNKIDKLTDVVDRKYVTIEMFSPVKLISYGTVAFITSICLAAAVSKLIQ